MSIKKIVLSTMLLAATSTAMADSGYDRDENTSDRHAIELRLKAFEGKTGYQVKVNPQQFIDRDEPVSTLNATELRLKAFEVDSFDMAKMGQTGGYDFSHDSVINDAKGHYRNHR